MADDVFLLDTNIISNSSKKRPSIAVTEWLETQRRVAIPFPVILEVETGIAEISITDPPKAALLRQWADELFETDFMMPLPNAKVAAVLGKLYSCRSLNMHWLADPYADRKRPGQDLFIAALSIVYDLPIATLDHKDFMQIHQFFELPGVYNPEIGLWAIARNNPANSKSADQQPTYPDRNAGPALYGVGR
ncbi:PIN domain-containing protein [Rhizobium rhizogenes]|jgi:predicted nucleic acid-binding protein|uniref:PIN domain-containing protein n=1 Tax=Rhizobium rhizogenes TaxID=359 RepID=UPI001571BCC3|nr:PIN domain-containing protein [Rhizobium rhizogenes]